MKKLVTEELILLTSVIKWAVLASFVGVVAGLSTSVFLKFLHWGVDLNRSHSFYPVLLPLSLLTSALLIKHLAPDAKGHGTEKVIEAVHKHSGRMKPAVIPVKLLATVVTIAGGGSAGKEGPAAQIGAGVASFFDDIFRFDETDRKKFVICGISAGFASVFGTPIAGAVFGIEVLFIGGMLYNVLLPSFVAGIVSYYVSSLLGVQYFYSPMWFSPNILGIFHNYLFFKVLIAGIFFGFCSLLLIEVMHFFRRLSDRMKVSEPAKAIAGGAVLTLLTAVFSRQYLGLGFDTIILSLAGGEVAPYAFLLKILFTAITLGFCGSGGVVTPIFFIGATSGLMFGNWIGADPTLFAAIGFVALLAGAANTPIAAAIMSVELFGSDILVCTSVACVVSFFITGHRSIFPSQVMNIQKSTSIAVVSGSDVEHLFIYFKKRKKSLIGFFYGLVMAFRRRKK